MANIASLLAKLELDVSGFVGGMEVAAARSNVFGAGMTGLAHIGGAVLGVGLGVAAAGTAALTGAIALGIKKAVEAQKIDAQLAAVLKSTGGAAGVTAEEVKNLSKELSHQTTFSGGAITSAQSLLLTFTSIGKDIFPAATQTVLDMSTALGTDLQSSVIQLGKALQDPENGITALRRVGVNFNDEQQTTIKNLAKTGHLEEAQALILQELQKEFGGSAKAAGQTFAGQMEILNHSIGGVLKSIGNQFLPLLTTLATTLNEKLADPAVQAAITAVTQQVADFAGRVVAALPGVIATITGWIDWLKKKLATPEVQNFFITIINAFSWLKNQMTLILPQIGPLIANAFDWLNKNSGVVVAALVVIGVAIAAFVWTTVIPAFVAMAYSLAPTIIVIGLIGGAAYLLYQAWTTNFGGIREIVATVWAFLQTTFSSLVAWLRVNIPAAIAALSDFWSNKLLPAIKIVWQWISTNLIPLFTAVGNLVGVVVKQRFELMVAVWKNVLIPVLQAMWQFIQDNFMPVLRSLGSYVGGVLSAAFKGLTTIIQIITGLVKKLTEVFSSMTLPKWLTPGSPTPLEMGLRGVADATKQVVRSGLPNIMSGGFSGTFSTAAVGGGAPVINIIVQSDGVTDDSDIARKIAGAIDIRLRERNLA